MHLARVVGGSLPRFVSVGHSPVVLCQVTSNAYGDPRAVVLTDADFAIGGLRVTSDAQPAKLSTAHESLFTSEVGCLHLAARQRIVVA